MGLSSRGPLHHTLYEPESCLEVYGRYQELINISKILCFLLLVVYRWWVMLAGPTTGSQSSEWKGGCFTLPPPPPFLGLSHSSLLETSSSPGLWGSAGVTDRADLESRQQVWKWTQMCPTILPRSIQYHCPFDVEHWLHLTKK